jgi:hypothetical protein
MITKKRFTLLLVFGLILASLVLMVTPQIVLAESAMTEEAEPEEDEDRPGFLRFFDGLIARSFAYQRSMVRYLGQSLEMADKAAGDAQLRITEMKQGGQDITILEDALDSFYDLIAEADKAQDAAENLIQLHDGFEDGKVVDLEKARNTVSEIEPQIKTVRENIVEAMRIIFEAIQTYREE